LALHLLTISPPDNGCRCFYFSIPLRSLLVVLFSIPSLSPSFSPSPSLSISLRSGANILLQSFDHHLLPFLPTLSFSRSPFTASPFNSSTDKSCRCLHFSIPVPCRYLFDGSVYTSTGTTLVLFFLSFLSFSTAFFLALLPSIAAAIAAVSRAAIALAASVTLALLLLRAAPCLALSCRATSYLFLLV